MEAAELVPGDVILLEAGDLVPADARLLEAAGLRCDESAMTGESVPVEKAAGGPLPEDAPLGDWTNMVISGTLVTAGRATALVTATGMDTQMGRIAGLLLEGETQPTPLQRKMGEISRSLSFLCLSVCAVMFGVGLLQGKDMLGMFLTAVSLAVAAIPEGRPSVVAISPVISLMMVDFPEPDGPTRKTNSPSSIRMETPFSALVPLSYSLYTSMNRIMCPSARRPPLPQVVPLARSLPGAGG